MKQITVIDRIAILGFIAIAGMRWSASAKIATFTLATVHGIAGLTIFCAASYPGVRRNDAATVRVGRSGWRADRRGGIRWLGAITPLGGVAFVLGWGALMLGVLKR